jgi:hypothetical protein
MTIFSIIARTFAVFAAFAPLLVNAADDPGAVVWSPYIVVSGEADDAHSSQGLIEVGSSIGASGWIRGGMGRATLANTEGKVETDVFMLGGGASIAAVDLDIDVTHRADGDAFKQQDWGFAASWQFGRGSIGADVFIRSADAETVTSVRRRRLDPREVRIVESIDGTGYGAHGDFDITPALTAFARWMEYDYDIETNRPILARFSLLNGSGITRSEAFLDRALAAGMTYRFTHASLTGEYMHDEALVANDATDLLQLSLLILIGDHWSLTPMAGVSDNDLQGNTGFGGLSVGFSW